MQSRASEKRSPLLERIATRRTVFLALGSALIGGSLPMVETEAKRKRRSRKRKNRPSSKESTFAQLDPNLQLPRLDPDLLGTDPCDAAKAAVTGFFPQSAIIEQTTSYRARLTVTPEASDVYCFIPSGEYQISFMNVTIRQYIKIAGQWIWIKPTLSGRIRVRFAVDQLPGNSYKFSEAYVLSVEIAQLPSALQEPVRTGMVAMFPESFNFTV